MKFHEAFEIAAQAGVKADREFTHGVNFTYQGQPLGSLFQSMDRYWSYRTQSYHLADKSLVQTLLEEKQHVG